MLKISINILFASFEIGLGVKFTVKEEKPVIQRIASTSFNSINDIADIISKHLFG
jgi:hypothetical protein